MKLFFPFLFTACSAHRELETAPKPADSNELYNKILAEALPTLTDAMKASHVFVGPVDRAPQRVHYWFQENIAEQTYDKTCCKRTNISS